MRNARNFWDRQARFFHVGSVSSKAHRKKYLRVADIILKENPKQVLDLGCGSGILEMELLSSGYGGNILAIDSSEEMLKLAGAYASSKNIAFSVADLNRDFSGGEKYDLIVSINLFPFLDKKEDFLKQIRLSLRDASSKLIFVTPKPGSFRVVDYVKEQVAGCNAWDKLRIVLSEIPNCYHYMRWAIGQKEIDALVESGNIVWDELDSIKAMVKAAKLNIISVEEIQAGQGWLFIIEKNRG